VNGFSLEPLLISFISSGFKLELLLTLLAFISISCHLEPLLMRILSVAVLVNEPSLIICTLFYSGSSYEPLLIEAPPMTYFLIV
jgi:hypothetical protein